MARFWRILGEYDAESDTYTAFAGGAGSSPYNPDFSGRLVGLRVVANRSAASSLVDHVAMRLSCQTFQSHQIEVGTQGSGLQTAPAFQSGVAAALDWQVDEKVAAGSPITLEGKNIGADTQVTVSCILYGCFEI